MSRTRRTKPEVFVNIPSLLENRNKYLTYLTANNVERKDLNKALSDMQRYKEFYNEHPLPKPPKKEKYGVHGMNQLADIVLNMKRDIKQIKNAQSLAGAKQWVEDHGEDRYEAQETDINGDNIPDIVVQRKNEKGELIPNDYVIVNGYTTADSTFPYRRAYYTEYPTKEARKEAKELGLDYRGFINSMYNPQYDEYGMKIQGFANQQGKEFARQAKAAGYKVIMPHNRSPYQAFTAQIIKPIYDVFKTGLNDPRLSGTAFSKIASFIWNQAILAPAMSHVYGSEVFDVEDEQWKKLRNKKPVKEAIHRIVVNYLTQPQYTFDFVPIFVDLLLQMGIQINMETAQTHVPVYLRARLMNKPYPKNEQEVKLINEMWEEFSRQPGTNAQQAQA